MELTSSNVQTPPFTSPKRADETKSTSSANNHRAIQLLPEHLIDQIKAGEVIERPSALLKELVENAIDADAHAIDVRIAKAGLDLISVSDDGHGMFCDDLPWAFTRHATSKIERFEDLYQLGTYGFRGEALASAASVARITAWTAPKEDLNAGGKIELHGGRVINHIPHHAKKSGTTIQVRDLFFNTPVRLQFVRGMQSERNAIERVMQAFIMANPHITFQITWESQDTGGEKEIYPAVTTFQERAIQLIKAPAVQLSYKSFEHAGHQIQAVVRTRSNKSTHKLQIMSANRRLFYDKSLHQILVKSMAALWPQGTTGEYIIALGIPKNKIDVNVHPNKTQLKFLEHNIVAALVRYVGQATQDELKEELKEEQAHSATLYPPLVTPDAPSVLPMTTKAPTTSLPQGWSLVDHPKHGLLLLDEAWLALEWWRSLYLKGSARQVPVLVAIPLACSHDFLQHLEEWTNLFHRLAIETTITPQGQLLVQAVPQELEELNTSVMMSMLTIHDYQHVSKFLKHGILPALWPRPTLDLPISHLNKLSAAYLIQCSAIGPEHRGPVRPWSALEQWWRH